MNLYNYDSIISSLSIRTSWLYSESCTCSKSSNDERTSAGTSDPVKTVPNSLPKHRFHCYWCLKYWNVIEKPRYKLFKTKRCRSPVWSLNLECHHHQKTPNSPVVVLQLLISIPFPDIVFVWTFPMLSKRWLCANISHVQRFYRLRAFWTVNSVDMCT